MPLKSGRSKETVSSNIHEIMDSYKKTGAIGTSRPASKKKAVKQAAAIAYDKAGKSTHPGKSHPGGKRKNTSKGAAHATTAAKRSTQHSTRARSRRSA